MQGAFVAGGESQVTSVPQFVKAVQRVLNDVMTEPPTPGRGEGGGHFVRHAVAHKRSRVHWSEVLAEGDVNGRGWGRGWACRGAIAGQRFVP